MTVLPSTLDSDLSLRDMIRLFAERGEEAEHQHLSAHEAIAVSIASVNGVDKMDLLRSARIIQNCQSCSLILANYGDSSKPDPAQIQGLESDDC